MARVLPLSEAKARLSQLVADVENSEEEVVITRNGRPLCSSVQTSLPTGRRP